MLIPVLDRDYRQLVVWSYVLTVRASLLSWAVALCMPFATVWLVTTLHRHADALSDDIAVFKRRVRARRLVTAAQAAARAGPPPGNPWV